jgi:glutathione S-transferase
LTKQDIKKLPISALAGSNRQLKEKETSGAGISGAFVKLEPADQPPQKYIAVCPTGTIPIFVVPSAA